MSRQWAARHHTREQRIHNGWKNSASGTLSPRSSWPQPSNTRSNVQAVIAIPGENWRINRHSWLWAANTRTSPTVNVVIRAFHTTLLILTSVLDCYLLKLLYNQWMYLNAWKFAKCIPSCGALQCCDTVWHSSTSSGPDSSLVLMWRCKSGKADYMHAFILFSLYSVHDSYNK